MYVLRSYGYDKLKIASAIMGVCFLVLGFIFFFYFYLVIGNLTYGWIFLGTFITVAIVFFVLTIIRQFTVRPKFYWGPAANYPQYPQGQYQMPQQQSYYQGYGQTQYYGQQQPQYYGQQQPQYYGQQQPQYVGGQASWNQPQYASRYGANWSGGQYPSSGQKTCFNCFNPARYINEYQRWYCDLCNRWL